MADPAFKLGRVRPLARCPRLSLHNYLLKDLPDPPAVADYSQAPAAFLSEILGNDTLGDCTAAGAFHVAGLLLANGGEPVPFTIDDVIKFYSATAGYVPGDESTDEGADEQTVLNYWMTTGLLPDQHRITTWVGINGSDADQVRTSVWLFENCYFGVEMPKAWITPFPQTSGFTWDVAGASDPEAGHCFVGVGYNDIGVQIDTWGLIGTITWAAIAKYASTAGQGELYSVLGPDAINKATQKAPNGFDFTQLTADIQAMKAT
jgi:hypothetical protein